MKKGRLVGGDLFLLLIGSFPNLESIGVVHLGVVVNYLKVDEAPFVEVNVWEESVGFELLVEAGQIEAVCLGQELLIDAASTHDEDFILIGGHLQSLRDRRSKFVAFGRFVQAIGDDDVAAVGQGFLARQREPSVVSHDDTMAAGNPLEMLQVVTVVPDELVVDANGAVGSHGDDDRYCHYVESFNC